MRAIRVVLPVAAALALAACSGSVGSSTTEALLPIATSAPSTTVPAGASSTSAPPEDGLSALQREAVDRLFAQVAAGDADAVIATWDIASDRVPLFEDGLRFDLALGGRWSDPTCGLSLSGDARCEFLYTDDLLEAVGAPLQESFVRIAVRDDGAITSWLYEVGNASTIQAMVAPFRDWIDETYPDLVDAMYNRGGFARGTPESLPIWVERVAEYRQTLGLES